MAEFAAIVPIVTCDYESSIRGLLDVADEYAILGRKGFGESLSSQYGVFISDIQQTSDGGFIVAGDYRYDSSEFSHALLIKLDSSGNTVWSENYGTNVENTGADTEFATSVHQTPDGGYIFAGSLETQRNFGTPCYASCAWVVKT